MSKKKIVPPYEIDNNITEYAVDSHTHLFQQENYEQIVSKFAENKIEAVVNVVESISDIKRASALSSRCKNVFYFAGLHPYSVNNFNEEYKQFLIKQKQTDSAFCGIGEIGLDYHFSEGEEYYIDHTLQQKIFVEQLQLAHNLSLPVSLHIRDAHSDAIRILKENKALLTDGGIIHCFSGTIQNLHEYLMLGFYISLSGAVTYKKASQTELPMADVIKAIPLDKLLIETDAPYLCPSPYRGRQNEPKYVLLTAQAIADVLEMNVNKLIKRTKENFYKLIKNKMP